MEGWEQGMDEGPSPVEQLVGRVASNLSCWSPNVLGAGRSGGKKRSWSCVDGGLFQRRG